MGAERSSSASRLPHRVVAAPRARAYETFRHVLRPNLTGASFKHGQKSSRDNNVVGINWLNPDAFALPDPFTLGNAARTLPGIRAP